MTDLKVNVNSLAVILAIICAGSLEVFSSDKLHFTYLPKSQIKPDSLSSSKIWMVIKRAFLGVSLTLLVFIIYTGIQNIENRLCLQLNFIERWKQDFAMYQEQKTNLPLNDTQGKRPQNACSCDQF